MLQPKRTKFRKAHKGRIHGKATSCVNLDFGAFGLKAQEPDRLTARQIEAARRALTRGMRRASASSSYSRTAWRFVSTSAPRLAGQNRC